MQHRLAFVTLHLPSPNEVSGKVIFSEACVKNSVHRGVLGPGGSAAGGAWSGGFWSRRGVPGGDPPMATAVGSMHPTGMHSCKRMRYY